MVAKAANDAHADCPQYHASQGRFVDEIDIARERGDRGCGLNPGPARYKPNLRPRALIGGSNALASS
jgi:hypothetical protein